MAWRAYVLQEDDQGPWLYTPEGSTVAGRRDSVIRTSYVGIPDAPGLHLLQLVPAVGGWWFGTWAVDRVGPRTAIDVCTPPRYDDGEWTYVDLELDLYRRRDKVGIFDRDEFDEACRLGIIAIDEAEHCLRTAASLDRRLRAGDHILDDVVWDHLAAGVRLGLPPLSDAPEP